MLRGLRCLLMADLPLSENVSACSGHDDVSFLWLFGAPFAS